MAKRSDLHGLGVLVTRPVHQAGHLCDLITAVGGRPIRFPTLAIRDLGTNPAVDARLARLADYHLAIFISPNAVHYGLAAIARHGGLPAGILLATVGNGSAVALQQALGRPPDIVPQKSFDSEALLALPALQEVAGRRILILRGEGGRELLAETLRRRGATVEYAEVYRRERPAPQGSPRDWLEKADIISITSSEALHNLVAMTPAPLQGRLLTLPLVVISERTAQLAWELGFQQPAIVTRQAGDEAILEAISDWSQRQRMQQQQ
jgi:uroporphyrinogen-III synthase